MKSIIATLLISVLFATINNAQQLSDDLAVASITIKEDSTTKIKPKKTVFDYADLHSKTAADQILSHLNNQLEYPEVMADYAKEGHVMVKVIINKAGEVKGLKIAESLTPEFDQAVLDALYDFKKLNLRESWYAGRATIKIPVHFSMKN